MNGLTQEQAAGRLMESGYNEIRALLKVSRLQILFRQVRKNSVVYLLLAAMLISFFVGEAVTGYAVLAIICIVIFVGFVQEYKAESAIKALKKMIMPVSVVFRNDKETEIQSREIVPGDIVVLRAGETVPADCLLLEEKELRVNESVLTGESKEIRKTHSKSEKDYSGENTLFMGTSIVSGKATAKVLHTGMNTEFGKIAGLISTIEKELPLQAKANEIAKYMGVIAIVFSVLTGIIMIIRQPAITPDFLVEVLIVVIALAVSAFPEGFPVVLISTLATGAYRMAKKNAIVNRMSIIETLGETTVICADKTGTITKGEMTVKEIYCGGRQYAVTGTGYSAEGEFLFENKKTIPLENPCLGLMLKAAVLCNDAKIERTGTDREYATRGTPTESALLVASAKAGIFAEDIQAARREEIPFSSERKMMTVVCSAAGENTAYAKGAPEILIKKCGFIQENNRTVKLTEEEKKKILAVNSRLAQQKLRTLALAFKKISPQEKGGFEEGLVFLGIAAMEDPPRDEVKAALETCMGAGIKVKMITGDNKETAEEIAKEIGLKQKTMLGEEIDRLTDEELSKAVGGITIFARVNPEHKLRIVKALKANQEIVTMTGDGVNDAPALKEAHIGVAMGKNGTDVSKESADLILKDNDFSTIVAAIREGRTVFNNIQKFITYQLSCNYAELFIIFFGILAGLPLPLLALQILFMNIVTDDLPAITLGQQPASADIMKAKPRRKQGILNRRLLMLLAVAGTTM
ncbi:MAG TPA: HAD-IC family P-type ATPase, partial [archaeon]|nr:HAD-IC family P-type ATPase [archaeon]